MIYGQAQQFQESMLYLVTVNTVKKNEELGNE
ncbi:hypothetical protein NB22_04500 [Limosilactobacillus fermentum NB-22]|uniref:Uncharacterized protein n=1 Tax=Limosilactobacillus fermentum NB-22 TaxID=1408443 RepID=A0A829LN13_LIMFE|nr:hypothetical protein N219_03040 [Limosilactobacillus fermentum MTCC 8711]ESS01479.1 hypothetical protein NB22_04500 [Limosilactobacillus fermentum NB-22]